MIKKSVRNSKQRYKKIKKRKTERRNEEGAVDMGTREREVEFHPAERN